LKFKLEATKLAPGLADPEVCAKIRLRWSVSSEYLWRSGYKKLNPKRRLEALLIYLALMLAEPTLDSSEALARAPRRGAPPLSWREEQHHPIVNVAQHLLSPLTATLVILAVHKSSQAFAFRAWWRAVRITGDISGGGGGGGGASRLLAAPRAALAAAAPAAPAAPAPVLLAAPPAAPAAAAAPAAPQFRDVLARPAGAALAVAAAAGAGGASTSAGDEPISSAAASPAGAAPPPAPADSSPLLDALAGLYGQEHAREVAAHLVSAEPVHTVELLLHGLRDAAALPWWATIVVATLGLRALLAPFNVALLRNSLRLKVAAREVGALDAEMARPGASAAERLAAAHALFALFRERRCHPLRDLVSLPLLVPPMILSIFFAVDNICLSEPAAASEGVLWFPSLLNADSTHLLPILSAMTWLANLEAGVGRAYHESAALKSSTRTLAAASWMLGQLAVGSLPSVHLASRISHSHPLPSPPPLPPAASNLPSGIHLFWVASNLFAIARGRLVSLPRMRALLHIPSAREVEAAAEALRRDAARK